MKEASGRSSVTATVAPPLRRFPDLRQHSRKFLFPVLLFGARDLRSLRKCLAHRGVEVALQTRQNPVPRSIAHMPQVAITLVLTPALSQRKQIGFEISA